MLIVMMHEWITLNYFRKLLQHLNKRNSNILFAERRVVPFIFYFLIKTMKSTTFSFKYYTIFILTLLKIVSRNFKCMMIYLNAAVYNSSIYSKVPFFVHTYDINFIVEGGRKLTVFTSAHALFWFFMRILSTGLKTNYCLTRFLN